MSDAAIRLLNADRNDTEAYKAALTDYRIALRADLAAAVDSGQKKYQEQKNKRERVLYPNLIRAGALSISLTLLTLGGWSPDACFAVTLNAAALHVLLGRKPSLNTP